MDSVILESVNLNDLAYEEIKKRIISREFAPGQRLVDSQLATIFQISQAHRFGMRCAALQKRDC